MSNKKKNRQITIKSQIFAVLGIVLIALASVICVVMAVEYGRSVPVILCAVFAVVLAVLLTIAMLIRDRKKYTMGKAGSLIGGGLLTIIDCAAVLPGGYCMNASFSNILVGIAFAIGIPACQFFTVNMLQRTSGSIALMGKILGLKNFIEAAELDRIDALVEENPAYYYDVLPYAYVMGLTDKWAKNFERINIQAPDWYQGYDMSDRMFDAWVFSSMINSFGGAVSSSVHIPIDDGDGDFGGGGAAVQPDQIVGSAGAAA